MDVTVVDGLRVRSWHHRWGPTDFPACSHAEVEASWVIDGSVEYQFDTTRMRVAAGQGMVLPARLRHATRLSPGARAGSAWLSDEWVTSVAAAMGRHIPARPTLLLNASVLIQLGVLLEGEAEEASAGRALSARALATTLAVALLRAAPQTTGGPVSADPRIRAVLRLIETRYAEALTVDDLARAAGVSRFHMSRLFRDELGMSPYQYLLRIRLERARELIATGQRVTDAALSVGFSDLGRFARAFRTRYGHNPREIATQAHGSLFA